jgi:hypothetical protein
MNTAKGTCGAAFHDVKNGNVWTNGTARLGTIPNEYRSLSRYCLWGFVSKTPNRSGILICLIRSVDTTQLFREFIFVVRAINECEIDWLQRFECSVPLNQGALFGLRAIYWDMLLIPKSGLIQ